MVGRVGGEGDDVTAEKEDALDGDYLTLNEDERSILEGLKELKDDGALRSIIVIINSANPISLPSAQAKMTSAFFFSNSHTRSNSSVATTSPDIFS